MTFIKNRLRAKKKPASSGNSFWSHIVGEFKANKSLVFFTAAFVGLSFSIYLYLDGKQFLSISHTGILFCRIGCFVLDILAE